MKEKKYFWLIITVLRIPFIFFLLFVYSYFKKDPFVKSYNFLFINLFFAAGYAYELLLIDRNHSHKVPMFWGIFFHVPVLYLSGSHRQGSTRASIVSQLSTGTIFYAFLLAVLLTTVQYFWYKKYKEEMNKMNNQLEVDNSYYNNKKW